MAVFLSPGVFPREIDLSALPTAIGPYAPALSGQRKKGQSNTPTLISNSQRYIDTFGEPFPESYLGYAALAYLEEGNECFVMRIGVECEDGQASGLSTICVDTSGARGMGWGRVPIFTGIDFGRINLRLIDTDNPISFHDASISGIDYNDAETSSTHGVTVATLGTTGTYTGDIDDSFVMVITSDPNISELAPVAGAGYEIVRNSDGTVVSTGTLDDPNDDGISEFIDVGDGVSVRVEVTSGVLAENDTFTWVVAPDNRDFSVAVEGDTSPTTYSMPVATYTTVTAFVAAFNALLSGEDYLMVEHTLDDGTVIPQIRTTIAGQRIQVMTTAAWALEVGTQRWAWDIPRSYLLGLAEGPYDITTQNNRVVLNVVGTSATQEVAFNIPVGLAQTATAIASAIDLAGVVAGTALFDSFALTVPGGTSHVVIVTTAGQQFDTLHLLANFSHLKTLRFSEELNIPFPHKRAYRGFSDSRATLPASGEVTPATPLSCETDPLSAACASDTSYFANIVGWLVAPSPGTWLMDYTVDLDLFTEGVGDAAGRYKLTVTEPSGVVADVVEDISFDKREDRYIANLINPGTQFGGTNGNTYVNWEERPAFLNNNVNDTATFEVRQPSQFAGQEFSGMANGIPADPAFSSELDAAVIGNPASSTGLYAFQNPEAIDINLLVVPGFSSGAVIGTALQLAESRGDILYLVDPPFGLRPQQVVDWHNGMLLSDLSSAINSSYGALYWGWLRVFDQFSSDEIWIPPSGHASAVFSRTAREAEQWFAPAGLRRGRLLTALDVEFSPTQGERDLLYGSGNAVNPIVKFPQDGITIWDSGPCRELNRRWIG